MIAPKNCPQCKRANPPTAVRCDCGYDFTGGPQTSDYTVDEIVKIASGQRLVIVAVLLSLPLTFLFPLQLLVLPLLWIGVWRMTGGLRLPTVGRVLYMIGSVLPLIPLVVLVALNARANKALQGAGIRVGLFGAKSKDVAALKSRTEAI